MIFFQYLNVYKIPDDQIYSSSSQNHHQQNNTFRVKIKKNNLENYYRQVYYITNYYRNIQYWCVSAYINKRIKQMANNLYTIISGPKAIYYKLTKIF